MVACLRYGRLKEAVPGGEIESLLGDSLLWSMFKVLLTPHCSVICDGLQEQSVGVRRGDFVPYRRDEPLASDVALRRGC